MIVLIVVSAVLAYACLVAGIAYGLARFTSFPPDLVCVAAFIWPIGVPMLLLALIVEAGGDAKSR